METRYTLSKANLEEAVEAHVRRWAKVDPGRPCTVRLTHSPAEQDGIHYSPETYGAEVTFFDPEPEVFERT